MLAAAVYVTTGTFEEAQTIARSVVVDRLAACANILGSISSIYLWQGNICEDPETVLFLKTHPKLITPLTERIKELHSFDCPCIAVLGIVDGNDEYFQWIKKQTRAGD
jgi:periplasmic divalent cation tolerance protein